MIQIKFLIKGYDFAKAKSIQFSNKHEENLKIMYEIAREAIIREKTSDYDQLMLVCCSIIVTETRKNSITSTIQEKVLEEISKYQSLIQTTKEIKHMSIDIKVDSIPRKVLELSFNSKRCLI